MVIGIIGAGISGLTAGRILAKAGHEVTIFEKSRGYGGRLATRYAGKNLSAMLDHGTSYFKAESPEFKNFVSELKEKGLVQTWGNKFASFDGLKFSDRNPNDPSTTFYTSTKGMNQIGKYLSRWVDVRTDTKVGGLTYFGLNRSKKRSWIMNLTTSEVVGVDAVVIALPAPQAYGILSTTIDEVNTLKIIRQIDEIHYRAAYSLMVGYGDVDYPEWEGIFCHNSILDFISNETLKRGGKQECTFVLQAGESFSRSHQNSSQDTIAKLMLAEFAKVTGGWSTNPEWHQLHFWRFSRAKSKFSQPYVELEDEDAPLALIGDYFVGNSVGDAYLSGYKLAKDWLEKFK